MSGNASPPHPSDGIPENHTPPQSFRKFRLRTMLVVPFVLQIVAAVSLVWWLSYRSGEKAVSNLTIQLRQEVSDRVSQHLDTYLATPLQINQMNLSAHRLGTLNLQNLDLLGQYFYHQMKLYKDVGYINFGSETGQFVGVGRQDDGTLYLEMIRTPRSKSLRRYSLTAEGKPGKQLTTEPYNPHTDGWYANAAKAKKPVWSQIYQWIDQPEIFSISASYPVYNPSNQFLGVMGVDLLLSQINAFLNTIQVSPSARIFILERDGLLVARSGSGQSYQVVNNQPQRIRATDSSDEVTRLAAQRLLQSFGNLGAIQTSQLLDFDLKGDRQFVQVTPWKDQLGLNWLIVIVIPESDFTAQINTNLHHTLWLCVGALAVAIGVGVLTARWITRPILRVTQASEKIARGDLNQQVEARGIIELEKLADAFNRMAGQLKGTFEEVAAKNADLQQSEDRNQAFLSAIPDLILRINKQGIYLDVVEAKGVSIVATRHNRIGKSVYDILPPNLAQQYMRQIGLALMTGETQSFEYQFHGQEHLGYFEARVVASGIDEVIFIVRDITDRKQAEDALRHSEATNRALISAIPDLLMRVRGDGTYLAIVGRDRLTIHEDSRFLLGTQIVDSLPPDLAQRRMESIQAALKTGVMQIYEHQLVIDGQTHDEEVRIIVCGEDEVLIMVRDITDRKRAEAALRIAEENYRSIFENALEGIFQSSPEGHFISVNPAMARIYGYSSPKEVITNVTAIETQTYVDPKGREEFKRLMDEYGIVKDLEYQIYRKDGSIIWIKEDTRAVRDANGRLLYYEGIVEDITQRKRLEAELKRQLQELQIEIDDQKRKREVAQITQSDYFQELQAEVDRLNPDEFWS
ncbi:PAS domain S-box protein [Kovacikia minuta CCNUW1]|uniref:PAS domain S-box protein n=1 Tax=Kovacikia minuta TaxID=2931930 RepID=UPI001CCAC538|nr:PAS domain S-box protein [Kovacikia minuta]UBF24564.1 PAS domain S-box protein [Kovacikia minuta CCNUW1]